MHSNGDDQVEDWKSTSRRTFLRQASGLLSAVVATPALMSHAENPANPGKPSNPDTALDASTGSTSASTSDSLAPVNVQLKINGSVQSTTVEPRTTLLDTLRDRLSLCGTKKGCDHGTCGACTVLVNGGRVLSCLTLTVMVQGQAVTTIEGLATGDQLHPMQQAFLDCDGFQCGFCTPGQILSAVACINEGHAHSDDEIREWMSGNLCRCAAYPNILEAVKRVASSRV